MSATINANDLKFVIFAAGHDYTLADSGDGEVQIYSHPYVPLNSVNYAGMYYFLVPDEYGDPLDAVKDDIAHCEFTPALGTAFSTEGETTVECHYHREYIHDEETIIVDKTVSQKITVVNHGSVSNAAHHNNSWDIDIRCDVYSDGYAFFRPYTTTEVGANRYLSDTNNVITKVSSIPWRANEIGYVNNAFVKGHSVADISELAFADVSNVTHIALLFDTYVTDISALAEWNTASLTDLSNFLTYNSKLQDISALENWDTSNVTTMSGLYGAFTANDLLSLHGLEKWDVSNVTDLGQMFSYNQNLVDISALINWDVSQVTDLTFLFYYCKKLKNLHGLELWDVSNVTDLSYTFGESNLANGVLALSNWQPKPTRMYKFMNNTAIKSLDGLENFDVSHCTDFHSCFQTNFALVDCYGVKDWDVSSATDMRYMFQGCWWLDTLKAFENWDFHGSLDSMFYVCSVLDFSDVIFDLSHATGLGLAFGTHPKCYSSKLGKDLVEIGYSNWLDRSGHSYTIGEVDDGDHPLSYYTHDASNAENWVVVGTNKGSFNPTTGDNPNLWYNVPTWN